MPSEEMTRYDEAIKALKVQNAVTSLATRFGPLLVMQVVRDWLAYMDAQVELQAKHFDGSATEP